MPREPEHFDHSHRQLWALIPWVVNGTAHADEQAQLLQHTGRCADCRAELEFQRTLSAGMQAVREPALDPQAGLDRLMREIDASSAPGEDQRPGPARPPPARIQRGLTLAVIAEAAALAMLSFVVLHRTPAEPPARYHTRSNAVAEVPGAMLRVVLARDLRIGTLDDLLQQAHLQVLAGPNPSGAYTLGAAGAQVQTASVLTQLRAQPGVLLAEPIKPSQWPPQ